MSEPAQQARPEEAAVPAEAVTAEAAPEPVTEEVGQAGDVADEQLADEQHAEEQAAPEEAEPVVAEEAAPPVEETQVAAVEAEAPAPVEEPQAAIVAPRPVFDIVRVEPTGESVIAGRSVAGATVELLRNGVVHDRVVADASGAFAFIPPPFPAGSSDVVLRSHGTDGAQIQSEQSVTIVVSADGSIPMVALVAPDQPTVVLSQPEPVAIAGVETPGADVAVEDAEVAEEAEAEVAEEAGAVEGLSSEPQQLAAVDAAASPVARQPVRIASVEAETGGGLYVTGEATPEAEVRLYLNDTFIAPAEADGEGRVTFSIQRGVRPGSYRVRLDEVESGTGSVFSRAEIVFEVPELIAEAEAEAPAPEPVADATVSQEPAEQVEQVAQEAPPPVEAAPEREASATVPEISTALVERGDSLWRISRTVYGSGFRYTEIFEANRDQIRNPDLIFPGQVFVLPPDMTRQGEAAEAPAPEGGAAPN